MDLFKQASKRHTRCNCRECLLDEHDKQIKRRVSRNKLKTELRRQLKEDPLADPVE